MLACSSVRRNLKRVGEPGTSVNLKKTKIWIRNCFTQNQSDFSPKIRWRAKKKVFTQILSDFLPKIRWSAKKIRSSLKFSPIFFSNVAASLHEAHKTWSNLLPNLQRGGGAMPQFCILFYAIIRSWRPKGGPWPNALLNTTLVACTPSGLSFRTARFKLFTCNLLPQLCDWCLGRTAVSCS